MPKYSVEPAFITESSTPVIANLLLKPYGFVQVCCVHLVKPQKTNVYLLLLSCAMVPLGTNILVLEFSFQELNS